MKDVKADDGGFPRRRYNSPKRAEAALERRRRMRAAAERLFIRDGYEPTTMLRIAAESGVAERTLYLAYPSRQRSWTRSSGLACAAARAISH